MSSIKLQGDTSGELTISAPAVAGTNTLTLPASSGTLATTAGGVIGLDSSGGVARATSGLLFNADTAAANILDDYEEGTWTPTAGSESGSFTAAYTIQSGKYTKIGNMVFATFDISLTSRTLSGSLAFLYGLPFAVRNNGDLSGSFGNLILTTNPGSNFYQISIYAQNAASYCYLQGTTSNTSGLTTLPDEFWGATTRISGGVIYNTA